MQITDSHLKFVTLVHVSSRASLPSLLIMTISSCSKKSFFSGEKEQQQHNDSINSGEPR